MGQVGPKINFYERNLSSNHLLIHQTHSSLFGVIIAVFPRWKATFFWVILRANMPSANPGRGGRINSGSVCGAVKLSPQQNPLQHNVITYSKLSLSHRKYFEIWLKLDEKGHRVQMMWLEIVWFEFQLPSSLPSLRSVIIRSLLAFLKSLATQLIAHFTLQSSFPLI